MTNKSKKIIEIPPSGLMNLERAAEYLSIKVSTLYYLRRTKQITCYLVGGKLRFRQEDLDAYVEKCRLPAADIL